MYVENAPTIIYSIYNAILLITVHNMQFTISSDIYLILVYYVTQLCTCTHDNADSRRRMSYIMYDAPEAFPKVNWPPTRLRLDYCFLCYEHIITKEKKTKTFTDGLLKNNV